VTRPQLRSIKSQRIWRVLLWGRALGAEAIWALAAFLLCAAFLLAGLKQLFPAGTMEMRFFESDSGPRAVSLENRQGHFQMNLAGGPSSGVSASVAILSRVKNEVKHKKANDIVWDRTLAGFELFERDAVQTLNNAKATITFDPENFLEMDENSLVIIRRLGNPRILRSRRSFMIIVTGRLRGRIDGSASGHVKLEIALPTGIAKIDTRDSLHQITEFEVNVLEDASTTITVFKGFAKVSANGKTVEVNANESTLIEKKNAPARPTTILNPVGLKAPASQKIMYYRDFPPDILFDWQPMKQGKTYAFQISKKTRFENPVVSENLSKSEFLYGNLKKGVYFWRVAAVDGKGVRGRWSPVRKIEVVQLLSPPKLRVSFPSKDEIINEAAIIVRGVSDRQAKIYINGDDPQERNAEGFSHEVPLKKGVNLILVESVDQVGNVSFERRLISRKY